MPDPGREGRQRGGSAEPTFIKLYYEMKRRNGYSDTEIAQKRESLENVLIPYRIQENVDLLKRNGFDEADTFFKWYNFAGLVALKKG
jgi:tRNA (cmo5U34)-methyltransferase